MGKRVSGDSGASLLLVLGFLALFGTLTSVLLSQTTSSLTRTSVTKAFQEKVYAADAGIDAGITQLRADDRLCPEAGDTGTLAPMVVNGKSVAVTCRTISGSALGARGYAVVTTDTSLDSFETQSGVGGEKTVGGSIFASKLSDSVDVVVEKGSVVEQTGCTSSASKPGGLLFRPSLVGGLVSATAGQVPAPPYSYKCDGSSDWHSYDPNITLPTRLPAAHPLAQQDGGTADCHIFRPGTYSAGIDLGPTNFLGSGVYYFPSGDIVIQNQQVVAGTPNASSINGISPCSTTVPTSGPLGGEDPTGAGATIILGGTARLLVNNPDGTLEIYNRSGGDSWETGVDGVSIITVPCGTTGIWAPGNCIADDQYTVGVGTGTSPALAAHGMLYMPGRMLDMNATNSSVAQLQGGVVAGHIRYQASASAGSVGISIGSGLGRRRLEVIATASESGSRSIISKAVIDIENDATRSLTVNSRYTPAN